MGAYNLISILILILTTVFCKFNEAASNASFINPDWETRVPDIFELNKKDIVNQRISKLRHKKGELLLPSSIVPQHYEIRIQPIIESSHPEELYTASGIVKISFVCISPTDSITLHAQTKQFIKIFEKSVKLEVKSSNLTGSTELKTLAIFEHWYDQEDTDFYKIQLSSYLHPGTEYSIYIEFETKISTSTLSGLYLSNYTDPDTNEIKHIAVTQFEDISARNMFPCFDEPHLKATFEIVVSRLEKYNSMSNMPKIQTVPDPDRVGYLLDYYPSTPPMSTYLVAIVVSEFTCTKASSFLYEKSVEACGPKHMINKGGGIHAAEISAKILKFYDNLFQQPYPLPKMQSVAIPDFEAGAMENYGLNTYRIKGLIYYPGITTEAERYGIELTVAHELAHQNFGNLVTCKTWNQIFLNEGFATFVSYIGVQEISPEFKSDSAWYSEYFQKALRRDAEANVHPLVIKDEYFGDFDSISYSKGASIIKMMEHFLTWETLHSGLKVYLEKFSFNNSEYHNLFETLNTQANVNKTHPRLASVAEIMEPWTLQSGFPLIRVQRVFQKMFYVSQERFRSSPIQNKAENETQIPLWYCPIFVSTSADSETSKQRRPQFWLTNKEVTKSWVTTSSVDWIIVNVDSSAFMRVLYDDSLTTSIQAQLDSNPKVFSPITRAQLIDDAFECGWARYSLVEVALSRTKFLADEQDSIVWSTTFGHFQKIYQMLADDPTAFDNFKNYFGLRVAGALKLIRVEQLPQDIGNIVLHRGSLLTWGSITEIRIVTDYAKSLIHQWSLSPSKNPVPIDIRDAIYCASLIGSADKEFEFIFQQYISEKDEVQKRLLLQALGCSTDLVVLKKLMTNASRSASGIKKSDGLILLQKIAGNYIGRLSSYWFIWDNFHELVEYFGSVRVISTVLSNISRYWNTDRHLEMVDDFVNEFSEKLQPVMHSVNQTVANIKYNINWMGVYGESIKLWLAAQPENTNNVCC